MNVITVSREYGAGGGELARRLGETLGWEVLDRELLHRAAALEHVPDAELERFDEQAVPLLERFRLHPPTQRYLHGLTAAVREAASRGRVVLVGRGANQLLSDTPDAFHLRLVAPRDWRVERMMRRESLTEEQAHARCREVDRTRERYHRYFFGANGTQSDQYHLVVNTGRVALDDARALVQCVVRGEVSPAGPGNAGVVTLARELGAGESSFAVALGERLALRVYDRAALEQEATALGIPAGAMAELDEPDAHTPRRAQPGSLYFRHVEVLEGLMHELAQRGKAVFVGRGASRFLRDWPGALHVRLVAPFAVRLRRVMEKRWLREEAARAVIASSDARRQGFYRACFDADWADPLEYHLTVNTGRLGAAAVDLVAGAARCPRKETTA
jgi:cytidylate kinase